MPTFRFPVLVWEDSQGSFTAALVEEDLAAFALSAEEAREQLRDYLVWRVKKSPLTSYSDFLEAGVVPFEVEIRPEYHELERIFPAMTPLTLRVLAVKGKQEDGLQVCALPMLGIRFYYHDPDELKGLVTHYVQTELKGQPPHILSRMLPPRSFSLEEVTVRVPRELAIHEEEIRLTALEEVAEPLGVRQSRRPASRAWERDAEVAVLKERLSEPRACVVLVGESGVGRTAVLLEAVQQVARAEKEERMAGRRRVPRFWMSSAARIVAGMQYLGEWQERCERMVEQLKAVDGVLCVENLLELVRRGGDGPGNSLAAFLGPYLQYGELRLIGEASPAEWDACKRLLPGFSAHFQVIQLPPLEREAAQNVLRLLAGSLEKNLEVGVDEDVIDRIWRLYHRFLPYQPFPGQATVFLRGLFDQAVRRKLPQLGANLVLERFIHQTGLPEFLLRDEVPLEEAVVQEALRARVRGQEAATRAVSQVITTFKAGLTDPTKPLAVLLFCGPTGVGKTELARTLFEYLFGHGERRDRLLRLDMSEYAGPGAARRLLSRPDGEPSELVRRLRSQPFQVVLLDEIEKAAPEVFDLLLNLFDEGRLTDRFGRVTSFRSAIIVMTSNLGAGKGASLGFGEAPGVNYEREVMDYFRPEFFNRLDRVVTFQPLGRETVREIARHELELLAQREGLSRAQLRLQWSDALLELVASEGFHPRYGARPLQRLLEVRVVAPLARQLVAHPELKGRRLRLVLDEAGELRFEDEGPA